MRSLSKCSKHGRLMSMLWIEEIWKKGAETLGIANHSANPVLTLSHEMYYFIHRRNKTKGRSQVATGPSQPLSFHLTPLKVA